MHSLGESVGALPGSTPAGCEQVCLPSSNSVYAVVTGDVGAVPILALHYVARCAIIGTGLWVAGFRGRQLVAGSAMAGAAFEASLAAWVLLNKRTQ